MFFSALYLIIASTTPILGYYALRLNATGPLNRIFLLISLSLTLWALGFSIVVVAPNQETAALAKQLAAIGYETVYSLIVHFALILTGHQRILKSRWTYVLLYSPAAVCLVLFAVLPAVTPTLFHYHYNALSGWMVDAPEVFDYVFDVYFVGAVLTAVALMVTWARRSERPETKRQANVLVLSLGLACVLGTLTDVLNGTYLQLPVPQMAPVLFLIPLAALFYAVRNYQLMASSTPPSEEIILNEEHRLTVFKLASLGLVLGGVILFGAARLWWQEGISVLTVASCAALIALGIFLYYEQVSRRGFGRLEALFVLTSVVLTPLLTINMVALGGISIWAFPIVLIVGALLFNSNSMLLAASVPALLGQVYLASVAPGQDVMIDARSYVTRTVILGFIVVSAYVVHGIYVRRLRENATQTRLQRLVSDILAEVSLGEKESARDHMLGVLEHLGRYFRAESALMGTLTPEVQDLIGSPSYAYAGARVDKAQLDLCMERWREHWRQEASPTSGGRGAAAEGDGVAREPWLFIPVYDAGTPVAFFYIEASRSRPRWTRDQLVAVPMVSQIVSDALGKWRSDRRIEVMAYYDDVTNLPNRHLFSDRAEQALGLARRNDKSVAVMFMDLDFFKSVNDTMGHESGDLVIRIIAEKLLKQLRKVDTVARFGGDEFLILINNIDDVDDISTVADKVLGIVKEPVELNGIELFLTASAGIAVFPADGDDVESLIKHADLAMYSAKDLGKNQYAFCSSGMKETVKYRTNLANHLYRALERREFKVYYQPQVDMRTQSITGVEALLRWFHPEYGMIPPLEFISIAEQTGLINAIGEWVLDTACSQAVSWSDGGLGSPRVAVNLSVVQLRNPALVDQIRAVVARTGIEPSRLELEITESATTKEAEYVVDVLNALKGLGVSISIDDFGTEYSSLNRLKLLPVDRLKMDIQFVRGIDLGWKEQAIARVIMDLAKNLDLKLVAEGVETRTQLEFLREGGCDEVQGYLYYKPMPAAEVEKLLWQVTGAM